MQKYKEIATHFQIIAPPFALSYFYDNVILLMLSYIVMETGQSFFTQLSSII